MWYFDMWSEEYGVEQFGEYPTKRDAVAGIKRVRASSKEMNDGIIRCYSEPYKEDNQ